MSSERRPPGPRGPNRGGGRKGGARRGPGTGSPRPPSRGRGGRPGGPPKGPRSGGERAGGKRPGAPRDRRSPEEQRAHEEYWAGVDARADVARAAGWGGVARRGTKNLGGDPPKSERADSGRAGTEDAELDPEEMARHEERARLRAEREAERSARTERLRGEARAAIERGGEVPAPPPKGRGPAPHARDPLPPRPVATGDVRDALRSAFGERRAPWAIGKLHEASEAFEAERFADAQRRLKPLLDSAPDVAEVRELAGLILYRQGRWKEAARQLEAFRTLAGSTEQHPVLADCYRALGRWADVEVLWDELREASPSAGLVTEGRIVAAGALADQGDLAGGIALLARTWRVPKKPKSHHLRRAYALADMYERSGELTRARDLFGWIDRHDPELGDARARVRALGS